MSQPKFNNLRFDMSVLLKALVVLLLSVAPLSAESVFEQGTNTATRTIYFSGTSGPSVTAEVLHGGRQEGTLLLTILTDAQRLVVSPSRGMNIMSWDYKTSTGAGAEYVSAGWSNPVHEIVNPIYINQWDRDGSGFLEGFNEVVTRCGFEFVGHSGWDGDEFLTLHGRNAATPAHDVDVTVDTANRRFVVTGKMWQGAFKKSDFLITSVLYVPLDGTTFQLKDTLRNDFAYDNSYMALYHSNFGGELLLEEGSTVHIAADQVWPFSEQSVEDVNIWQSMSGPRADFDERVYNIYPLSDANGRSAALLVNKAADSAIQLEWDQKTLPVFSLWKNLDLRKQGYVVGLEPGTSFSYNRAINRELELVPSLKSNAEVVFDLSYSIVLGTTKVEDAVQKIKTLQGASQPKIYSAPLYQEARGETDTADISKLIGSATLAIFTALWWM